MPFDASLDKILQKWQSEETGLIISINQYGSGEPKLQIGPRVFRKKDGGERQGKAGRLTIEDVMWLHEHIDEIKDAMAAMTRPE